MKILLFRPTLNHKVDVDGMVLHSAVEGVQFGGGLQSFDGLHASFPSQFVIVWDAGSLSAGLPVVTAPH